MKTHGNSNPTHKCTKCEEIFVNEAERVKHTQIKHRARDQSKVKQYNCKDCPFQGENGLELKRHVMRTKHTPSEYKEQCYTCKKEFESYFHLMNHRKVEHPSNKVCRYFRKKVCIFEAGECWYSH